MRIKKYFLVILVFVYFSNLCQISINPISFNVSNCKFIEIQGNGYDIINFQDKLFLKLYNTLNSSKAKLEFGFNDSTSKTDLTLHSNIYYSFVSGSSFTSFGKLWSAGS